MIGPSASGASFRRFPPVNMPALPVATNLQSPAAQPDTFSGFSPTWQALTPRKEILSSPSGYPLIRYTLPNGHRLFVEQRPTDVIGVRTFVNAGSTLENPVYSSPLYQNTGLPSGIAHLDEHCHFLATEHFPVKNSLNDTLDATGISNNASTSHEAIQHEFFFNREDLGKALKLHAESVLRPIYNAADVEQEKTNVLNERAMRMRLPHYKLYDKLQELLFDRPFTQTLGTQQDVMRTTPQQFQQFRNLAYAPTNLVTVVSGNVNPDDVLSLLAPEFGSNPPRYSPAANMAMKLALQPGEVRSGVVVDPQFSSSRLFVGFPAPPVNNLKDRIAMEFLREILDSDSMSLLQNQVVNQQQLASRLNISFEPFKQAGLFMIDMETTPGREQSALGGTLQVLSRLSQGLISDQTIAQVRERLIRRFQEHQNNVGGVTYRIGEEALNNTLPYYLNYVQLASLITAEDLLAASQNYLNFNRYAVVYGVSQAPAMGAPQV